MKGFYFPYIPTGILKNYDFLKFTKE